MKNFTIIHILLFLLCMLIYKCASSQDYVVTAQGDTVQGELRILPLGPEKKVQIRADKKKETYSILGIRSFYYKNEVYYPKKGPHGYTFMKLIKPGFLSLYSFDSENSTTPGGYFLSKADGQGIEVPNLGFKKQLAKFLNDCGDLSSQIEEGDFGRTDLDRIIDDYNACIAHRSTKIERTIVQQETRTVNVSSWDILEEKINAQPDFNEKATALEMVTDIKSRLKRGEKIPNFIIEGLKNTLAPKEDLAEYLTEALGEL